MKNSLILFFIITLFLSAGNIGLSQTVPSQIDSLKVKPKTSEKAADSKDEKVGKETETQNNTNDNKPGQVKQVKSARPDMRRSRGARPPDIVRPSGSRIPRGVGRPAGAGRRGRG